MNSSRLGGKNRIRIDTIFPALTMPFSINLRSAREVQNALGLGHPNVLPVPGNEGTSDNLNQ